MKIIIAILIVGVFATNKAMFSAIENSNLGKTLLDTLAI